MESDKFKQIGVVREKFYYMRSNILLNVYTVCLLLSEDNKILGRGICICSIIDQHNKKFARKKSRDRAIKAVMTERNCLPINIEREDFFEITRSFKRKNGDNFEDLIVEADNFELPYWFSKHNGNEFLNVKLNSLFPLEITKQQFNYKSYFKPEPTDDEQEMLKGAPSR